MYFLVFWTKIPIFFPLCGRLPGHLSDCTLESSKKNLNFFFSKISLLWFNYKIRCQTHRAMRGYPTIRLWWQIFFGPNLSFWDKDILFAKVLLKSVFSDPKQGCPPKISSPTRDNQFKNDLNLFCLTLNWDIMHKIWILVYWMPNLSVSQLNYKDLKKIFTL